MVFSGFPLSSSAPRFSELFNNNVRQASEHTMHAELAFLAPSWKGNRSHTIQVWTIGSIECLYQAVDKCMVSNSRQEGKLLVAISTFAEPLQSVHDTTAMSWVFTVARFLFLWGKKRAIAHGLIALLN